MFSYYLKTLFAFFSRTATTTRAGLVEFVTRSSPFRFSFLLVFVLSCLATSSSHASTLTTWTQLWGNPSIGGFATAEAACSHYGFAFYRSATTAACGDYKEVAATTTTCPLGDNSPTGAQSGLKCNASCDSPNTMVDGQCSAPPPPPECPEGAYWDFDSLACKYPQDDACDSIGASWEPASTSCKCDSPTAALVTAAGVTRCMQLRDDSCDSNSPDFKGYATFGDSAGQAVCDGRASCPDGGTPGYVGSGDTMSAVCYNSEPQQNDNCDGVIGVQDGVQVCVPRVGANDPDFPDCDGVVGTFNGVKRCIDRPGGHAGCNEGETPGYVGAGDDAQFTCIPSNYKPETCPPGQYYTNSQTGAFACVTASGQSKDDVAAGKVPGTATGTSTTTQKDANGNVIGTEETTSELNLKQLLEDAPSTDFKKELDKFSESELVTLDMTSAINSFSGTNGAFTERNSLDNVSNFVLTHTIGNNTNCNGTLPFFGYTISCSKFDTYNRIVGWMIFILTIINIYNVIIRPSQSGV